MAEITSFINDFLTSHVNYFYKSFLKGFIDFLLYGGGIVAIIQSFLFLESMRIYTMFKLFIYRERLYKHPLLTRLENLRYSLDTFNTIEDEGKKELALSTFQIEMTQNYLLVKRILRYILKGSRKEFLKDSFFILNKQIIISHIIKEIDSLRINMSHFFRARLRHDISPEDLNRFLKIYYETTEVFHTLIIADLEKLYHEKNLYGIIWNILNRMDTYIYTYSQTIPSRMIRANGRLSGIKIKGYTVK